MDQTSCVTQLKQATDAELWDVFLTGQVELCFDSEFIHASKGTWWQEANNILEIGSGNGSYLHRLACHFQGKTFKGIEKSPQFVERARARYAHIAFEQGDAEACDSQLSAAADMVVFRYTLQHLKDALSALKNAAQYLTPSGYVWIIDSYDNGKKTSHPLPTLDAAIQLAAKAQEKGTKGNRYVTLELLQTLTTSPLSSLYETVYSNLDTHGTIIHDNGRLEGEKNRKLAFNQYLLFLTLVERTYHIPVDINQAYHELRGYLKDEHAWITPGIHVLVLKKKCP